MRPYRKGLEQKIPVAPAPQKLAQGLRINSFLREAVNRVPFGSIQGVLGTRIITESPIQNPRFRIKVRTSTLIPPRQREKPSDSPIK